MTVGEKIRLLRKSKGLTQDAVAFDLGVSRQAIAKWEGGQSSPNSENLIKLANLLSAPIDELTDTKPYQPTALEEYVRQKLENRKKFQEAKRIAFKMIQAIALILIAYIAVYGICLLVFYLAGIRNCIWKWMQSNHILMITCLVHVVIFSLGKKIVGVSLFLGTIVAIIVSNTAGLSMMRRSPIGYNNGWVFYLATLFVFYIIGFFAELKVAKPKNKSLQGWRKAASIALFTILSIFFVTSTILSVRHVKYGIGAESGYQSGYAIGAADATVGKPLNSSFSSHPAPTQYVFGSSEFKGYAVYWPAGYKRGYEDIKQAMANDPV